MANGRTTKSDRLPRHIGIVMDGNGRWAKKRLLPRLVGHKAGVDALDRIIRSAYETGVEVITVYAFSTENWKRDKKEVDGLFDIFRKFISEIVRRYEGFDIRLNFIGDIRALPEDIYASCRKLMSDTADRKKMVFNVGLNYGGRAEIVNAVSRLIAVGAAVTEEAVSAELYTGGQPDPDMIIRTGGEKRLSNFMTYQSVYSELFFTDTLWPDFSEKEFLSMISDFSKRDRRFGSVK